MTLAVDRAGYDHEGTDTRDVYRVCESYGIADQNLAQNLIGRGNYVTRRGPRGSQTYRLTVQGLEAARETIVALARGTGAVEV
jgi:hypothetical protein